MQHQSVFPRPPPSNNFSRLTSLLPPQPHPAPQFRGHEAANLDPLGLHSFRSPVPPPELDYKYHGFTDADLDRVMNLRGTSRGGHKGFLSELADGRPVTLRQVVEKLKQTYCQTLGVEYMHMSSRDKCNWIRARVETPLWLSYSKEKKLHIFERLAYADHFERFLGNKYNTAKRFGLDGGEAVIPGLKVMIDRASEQGVTDFVFGMPHRGRLNVLANVLRKPMQQMFQEFQVRSVLAARSSGSVWNVSCSICLWGGLGRGG